MWVTLGRHLSPQWAAEWPPDLPLPLLRVRVPSAPVAFAVAAIGLTVAAVVAEVGLTVTAAAEVGLIVVAAAVAVRVIL